MNKLLMLLSVVLLSVSSYAQASRSIDGHTYHVLGTKLSGDLAKKYDNKSVGFGYDYTAKDGWIFGVEYIPTLLSESVTLGSFKGSVESGALALYNGYQLDENVRLIGGLNFTFTDSLISNELAFASGSEVRPGIVIGADYVFNQYLFGGRIFTHKAGGMHGVSIGFSLGYKFPKRAWRKR